MRRWAKSVLPRVNNQSAVSRDEEMARELQAQYDRENEAIAVAQPVMQDELLIQCGECGLTHVVRNATHGSTFLCTTCGAETQILLVHHIPYVDRSFTFVPVPIICNIM